jgi:Domain of unknown function (DUF4834)
MYQEASFSGVLRILFWFFVISMAIRLLARLLLPYILKKSEQTMRERMQQMQEQQLQQMQEQQRPQRHEGEVTIEKNSNSRGPAGTGEYVDYEEIKD